MKFVALILAVPTAVFMVGFSMQGDAATSVLECGGVLCAYLLVLGMLFWLVKIEEGGDW